MHSPPFVREARFEPQILKKTSLDSHPQVPRQLEGEVREKAAEDLRQSALAAGILTTAHQNACATVTKLLLGLNFTQVTCS